MYKIYINVFIVFFSLTEQYLLIFWLTAIVMYLTYEIVLILDCQAFLKELA